MAGIVLLAGCSQSKDFVQGPIRIAPPIRALWSNLAGPAQWGTITDAKGRTFAICILSHTNAPATTFLSCPGSTTMVQVRNEKEFQKKLGLVPY